MNKFQIPNSKFQINSNGQNPKLKKFWKFEFGELELIWNLGFRIWNFRFQRGQSLVELLLVIGLSSVVLPALLLGFVSSREGKAQQHQRSEAVALLRETVEAVRSIREKEWTNLATNGTFHPEVSGSSWTLIAGADTVNGLSRQVVISDVQRDSSGAIAATGILDPSTKKVEATISWGSPPFVTSIKNTLYLTRYLDNNAFSQTAEAEFNLGTKSDTRITNASGGEVALGDWCSPNLIANTLNLPKNGVANAVTAIEGRAFAGTGDTASGESFVNIEISDSNPPVPSILGMFSDYKTNDIFGEPNYGYMATDTNDKEIVIISLTTYTEIGYFDASGSTDANSVYIVGDTGYMTQGNRLRNFDLASCSLGNRTGSCSAIDTDGAEISATGTSVYVVGNYAFVSISGHSRELEIFDVSIPSSIVRVGWVDVSGGTGATDVFVNPSATRAYIARNASSTLPEFFIIDVTDKNCSDCPDIGTYNAGTSTSLKGVEVVSAGKRAIVVGGPGGEEYQVIDTSTEIGVLPRCGGMDVDLGIKDSASVIEADGEQYSYIVTGDVSSEFKIIKGGALSGTFESNTFDAGSSVAYNRFDVSLDRVVNTNIEFQVAVKAAVGPDCSTVTFAASDFVGPSGTSSDRFQTTVTVGIQSFSFAIPINITVGQCFRYKAYLSTTEPSVSPVLHDVTVNYSP